MRQRVRIAKTIQFGLLRKKAYPLTKKRICFFVFRNELQGAVLTLKYRSELVIVTLVENLAIYFSRLFKTASTGHQQASTDDIATVSPLLYGSCYDFILQRVVKKNKIIGKATYTNPQIFIIFRCLLCVYQVFF